MEIIKKISSEAIEKFKKSKSDDEIFLGSLQERTYEAKYILELFKILETNWPKNEKEFFVIPCKWLKKWKAFISFDEFEAGKPVIEFTNNLNPGNISIDSLLLDPKTFYHDFTAPNAYNNNIIKENLKIDEDYKIVSCHIWKFLSRIYPSRPFRRFQLQTRNGMEEIDIKLTRVFSYIGENCLNFQ